MKFSLNFKPSKVYLGMCEKLAKEGAKTNNNLSGILIRVKDNLVNFYSTDGHASFSFTTECKSTENGSALVSAASFISIVSKLEDREATLSKKITENTSHLIIKDKGGSFKLSLMIEENLPVKKLDWANAASVSKEHFLKLVESGICIATENPIGYVLDCLNLHILKDSLEAYSTDKSQGTKQTIAAGSDTTMVVNINRKHLPFAKDVLKSFKSDEVLLQQSDNHFGIKYGNAAFTCPLISINYPNIGMLFKNIPHIEILIDKNEFCKGLDTILTCSDSVSGLVEVEIKDKTLKFTAHNSNSAGEVFVPCSYEGEPLEFLFSGRKLLNACLFFEVDTFRMFLDSPVKTIMLNDYDDFYYVSKTLDLQKVKIEKDIDAKTEE